MKRHSPDFTQLPSGHRTCSFISHLNFPGSIQPAAAIFRRAELFKHTSLHCPTRCPLTPGSRECTCEQSALPRSTAQPGVEPAISRLYVAQATTEPRRPTDVQLGPLAPHLIHEPWDFLLLGEKNGAATGCFAITPCDTLTSYLVKGKLLYLLQVRLICRIHRVHEAKKLTVLCCVISIHLIARHTPCTAVAGLATPARDCTTVSLCCFHG